MTDPLYKRMTALLLDVGIGDQPHSGKTYLGIFNTPHSNTISRKPYGA